jgi:hypothetical protein
MRIASGILGVLLAAAAGAADNPLATRAGWDVGGQAAQYRYEEPDLVVSLKGNRIGAMGAYTVVNDQRVYARIELRQSYGELDYQGSGTMNNVPDQLFEVRALAGRDYPAGKLVWSPYVGGGFRYLYNDLRGFTSTGAIGYRRDSSYFYVPLGVTLRMRLGEDWVLAPQLEYDAFVHGIQRTYLADTGLGFNNVSNQQRHGRGYRAQLMFEGRRWSFGPWLHYWNIKDSDIQPTAPGFVGFEPANWTRESGVELRYRF